MDKFMQAALTEARTGAMERGIPIGAALADGTGLWQQGVIADCKPRPQ